MVIDERIGAVEDSIRSASATLTVHEVRLEVLEDQSDRVEALLLEIRDEYQRRMGEHYQIKAFHEALLRYGELPLPVVRQLMLGDY